MWTVGKLILIRELLNKWSHLNFENPYSSVWMSSKSYFLFRTCLNVWFKSCRLMKSVCFQTVPIWLHHTVYVELTYKSRIMREEGGCGLGWMEDISWSIWNGNNFYFLSFKQQGLRIHTRIRKQLRSSTKIQKYIFEFTIKWPDKFTTSHAMLDFESDIENL